MQFNGLIGGTYTLRDSSVESQLAMNVYPETVESGGGSAPMCSFKRPGLKLNQTLLDSPGRGIFACQGRCWALVGLTLYELFSDATSTPRAAVPAGDNVQFAATKTQMFISVGSTGQGVIYDLVSNAYQVVIGDFPTCSSVAAVDGYFVVSVPNSAQFNISAQYDGRTWDGLDFALAEGTPGNIVRIQGGITNRELWVYQSDACQPYYNSGDPDFPFLPMQGTLRSAGSIAPASHAFLNNTRFWLGGDEGGGIVYAATGYAPEVISNHAVAQAMQTYSTIADAVGYAFEFNKHGWYVLSFPTANATWVYDLTTGMWTQWDYWNMSTGQSEAFLGRWHAYAFGKHLMLDWKSGNVYEFSATTYDDNGSVIRWLRRSPHIDTALNRNFYHALRVGVATGVGLSSGQGSDPLMLLRWSDDGAKTWSNQLEQYMGKIGESNKNVEFNRLGSGRLRVFEISGSDPVPVALRSADLRFTPGVS